MAAPYKSGTTFMSVLAAGDALPDDDTQLAPQIWGWERSAPGDYWGQQPAFSYTHRALIPPEGEGPEGEGDLFGLDFVSGTLYGWAVGVDTWTGSDLDTGLKSLDQAIVAQTTDGGWTWHKQTLPVSTAALRGVSFADVNAGVAVGTGGTVFRTTNGGVNWATGNSGVTSDLNGVAMATAAQGWAVGTGGVIRKTLDGGATWTPFSSGTSANLTAIAHVSGTTFVVVGSGGFVRALHGRPTPPNNPPCSLRSATRA